MGAYEIFSIGSCLLIYICWAVHMIMERETVLGTLTATGIFVIGLSIAYPLFVVVAPTLVAILFVIFIVAIIA